MGKKNYFISFVFILLFFLLLGCKNNKKNSNSIIDSPISVTDTKQDNNTNSEIDEVQKKVEAQNKIEEEIKQKMENFMPAIEFYKEYTFNAVDNVELGKMKFVLGENDVISCYYDTKLLCEISDFTDQVSHIYNNCIPYNDNRLVSSLLEIELDNDAYYFGIINLSKGKIKLYKSLQEVHHTTPPFYDGDSLYFIINNIRIVKPSYYDYKTFKTVDAVYGGYIELYNFDTDELLYRIDKKSLHEVALYSIDKIQYDPDGFRITIGNYHDSDEYTDFKLYTDDNNFRYEIFNSYSYPVYDSSDDDEDEEF